MSPFVGTTSHCTHSRHFETLYSVVGAQNELSGDCPSVCAPLVPCCLEEQSVHHISLIIRFAIFKGLKFSWAQGHWLIFNI